MPKITHLDLDEQQRLALATACAYTLALADRMPGHWVRPGVVGNVAAALEKLAPTQTERGGRPFVLPVLARKHVSQLIKASTTAEDAE